MGLVVARGVLCRQLGRPTALSRAEDAVPEATQGAEGVVAALVALVVPVVVVRHLGIGQPPLQGVRDVEVAANSGVLLEALEDSKNVRKPEAAPVQRHQNLGEEVPHEGVREVVHPVVLVGVPRQWVPGPVVVGVDVVPEPRHDVQRTVHPVHAEGQDVVVRQHSKSPLVQGGDWPGCWIVARHRVVEAQVEHELTDQGDAVVPHQGLQLLQALSAQVLLGHQSMLPRRLSAVLRTREEHCFQVGVVDPRHNRLRPHHGRHLFRGHGPGHVHLLGRQQAGRRCHSDQRGQL
mmetsp:Transcript_5503/g.7770  ORF Transcript_5503/g.7770 Transcript_5503/m.7770 type:complete len:291 (+) Transcript_5503:650-1522(+)